MVNVSIISNSPFVSHQAEQPLERGEGEAECNLHDDTDNEIDTGSQHSFGQFQVIELSNSEPKAGSRDC